MEQQRPHLRTGWKGDRIHIAFVAENLKQKQDSEDAGPAAKTNHYD